MSVTRMQNNPVIQQLLREHDALDISHTEERMTIQRRILFLMTTIKMHELEEERNAELKKTRVDVNLWPLLSVSI
jgi:hypothetical protein